MLKGELTAELDSAKVKLSDLFTKTIYKNHFYGNSYTKILEELDNITIEDVKNSYNNILKTSKKVIAIIGDVKIHYATELLEKYLSDIPTSCTTTANINPPSEIVQESAEIIKNDAQQAQIVQGWKVPQIGTPDYPKLMLLNVILGASGLSSRLFIGEET